MQDLDVVVVGAGVVGLAIAREFALRGRDVIVLEAAQSAGTQTSSRSSEVIHAGLYYPTGSLKARLCTAGRELLYRYAAQRAIGVRRCGKILVANSELEVSALKAIERQALANGVEDLEWLDAAKVRQLEPALRCKLGLLSPSTGIVDSHALMMALLADLERAGGTLVVRTRAENWSVRDDGISIDTDGEQQVSLRANIVVNAAGHGAPHFLRRLDGYPRARIPTQYFVKGSYFKLNSPPPFSHLIYPIPETGGLGVHATLDQAGGIRFGPDIEWVSDDRDLAVDPTRASAFETAIRRFWPDLPDQVLTPDYAGIRPRIHEPETARSDFLIEGPRDHGLAGVINLLGIESPGLTSCLAIAEYVVQLA